MKRLFLLLHTVFFLFLLTQKLTSSIEDLFPVVLLGTVYLIIIILPEIITPWQVSISLILLGLILLVFLLSQQFQPFLLLSVFHIIRLFLLFQIHRGIAGATLFIMLPIIPNCLLIEYLFSSAMIFIIYFKSTETRMHISKLVKKVNTLEKESVRLIQKLGTQIQAEKDRDVFTRMDERAKISQKIHDELGHSITGSIFQLEAAKTIIHENPVKSVKMMDTVISAQKTGLDSIRAGMRALKPGIEELGAAKVRAMLKEFESKNQIKTSFTVLPNPDILSIDCWQVVYRNLKEGLTNILKHSDATVVNVTISSMNKLIKAEIRDNGTITKQPISGFGLTGMEERTASVSGQLIVDWKHGFSIIMIFPKKRY
ncbi:MAG: sensor histidine kinase [Spirochaetia bacterium]